jgi:hypothetical protein
MRQILLQPKTAEKVVEDLEVLLNDVQEEISDLISDGDQQETEAISRLTKRADNLVELVAELRLTRVIVAPVSETPEMQRERQRREIIDEVATTFFGLITDFDNDVIEEQVEEYMALVGLVPLVPLDKDDDEIVGQYLEYEREERRIYRQAWLELAKKLMDEFAGTEAQ